MADRHQYTLLLWPSAMALVQCSAVEAQCLCSAAQRSAVHLSAVQCSAVQYSGGQCLWRAGGSVGRRAVIGLVSAVQCSAVQCSAVQCSAVRCSAVQWIGPVSGGFRLRSLARSVVAWGVEPSVPIVL
jgi:hypothetical protein